MHAGPCADGGEACDPSGPDCPDRQICGFRVADGCSVTTAHCFDGHDPTLPVSGVLEQECSCDGGVAATFVGEDAIVSSPVPGPPTAGRCLPFDAGLDAGDASDAD